VLPERMKRVEEQVARELGVILDREIRDPRVGMVTISRVHVSRDLRKADIYVSRLGEDEESDRQCLEGLEGARGYIRRLLGRRVVLKYLPELAFHLDTGPRQAMAIEAIFRQIHQERDETDDEETTRRGDAEKG
jgi:ribosome-binding factor A